MNGGLGYRRKTVPLDQPAGGLGEEEIRIFGLNKSAGKEQGLQGRCISHHHNRGLSAGQLFAITRMRKKARLARAGAGKTCEACDVDTGISKDRAREALGQLACGDWVVVTGVHMRPAGA